MDGIAPPSFYTLDRHCSTYAIWTYGYGYMDIYACNSYTYRPGLEKPSAQFFGELTAVLETLVINACPVEIGGDFNVRFQLAADPDSRLLKPCEILCKCYTRELVA